MLKCLLEVTYKVYLVCVSDFLVLFSLTAEHKHLSLTYVIIIDVLATVLRVCAQFQTSITQTVAVA